MFKWKKWNNPDLVEKVKKTKGESFYNIRGSVANHIMWDLENQELITMCGYLEKFYGLMIYRKDFEGRLDDLFEGCINEIRNAIGVYLKILEKPMKKQFEIDLERKEMKELKKKATRRHIVHPKNRGEINSFQEKKFGKDWVRLEKMGKWSRLIWSLTSDSCSRLSPSLLQISTKMIFDASRDILTTQIWWRRGFSHTIALIQLRRWKTRSCHQRKNYFKGFVINTSKMLNMNMLTFWQKFGCKIVADYHNLYLKTRSYPRRCFSKLQKGLHEQIQAWSCVIFHITWPGLGCSPQEDGYHSRPFERSRHALEVWKRNQTWFCGIKVDSRNCLLCAYVREMIRQTYPTYTSPGTNQHCNKILKRDLLSQPRFEHL